MKKILFYTLILVFSLTLSACTGEIDDVVNTTDIESSFTVSNQTVDVNSDTQDWAAVVSGMNSDLPDSVTVSVVEENVDYTTPGTYTVTVNVTGDDVDFNRTFDVVVEQTSTGQLAATIVDGYNGDVTYLSQYMDPIMNSDTKETVTTINLSVNVYNPETEMTEAETLTIVSTTTFDESTDVDVMHQNLSIDMNGESMMFDMYLQREDDALTLYMESALVDYLSNDPTLASDLGITEDYMTFEIAGDFTSDDGFDVSTIMSGVKGYIDGLMADQNITEYQMISPQLNYVVSNISVFAKYLTLDYYMNQEGMTAELAVNDDDQVVADMTMANTAYASILADLVTDFETFATGLNDVEVPDIQSQPEYQQLVTILNGLQPMQMDAIYDPTNPDQMTLSLDLSAIANTIMAINSEGGMTTPPVNTFTVDIVVNTTASISLPTNTSSINSIIPNLLKTMFVSETAYLVEEVVNYYNGNDLYPFTVDTTVALTDLTNAMNEYNDSLFDDSVFDQDSSYIVNRGTDMEPDFYYQLVWADGQDVFVRELGVMEVYELLIEPENFTTVYGLVNDAAFDYSIVVEFLD